jgi:hypothetical protein
MQARVSCTLASVEMRCAECGCLVDRRAVVERCGNPNCCCDDLPDKRLDFMAGPV